MSRGMANVVLVTHFALVWGAFVLRVDLFPLTWAPMYSHREGGTVDVAEWDRTHQLRAVRRDGSVEWLSRADLNIPTLSFWRLYYERTFDVAPNIVHHGNLPMEPWCYWLRGTAPGEPLYEVDWSRRVLTSVNATLGREWAQPDFIVALEAHATVAHFAEREPDRWWTTHEVASLSWDERWNARGDRHDALH